MLVDIHTNSTLRSAKASPVSQFQDSQDLVSIGLIGTCDISLICTDNLLHLFDRVSEFNWHFSHIHTYPTWPQLARTSTSFLPSPQQIGITDSTEPKQPSHLLAYRRTCRWTFGFLLTCGSNHAEKMDVALAEVLSVMVLSLTQHMERYYRLIFSGTQPNLPLLRETLQFSTTQRPSLAVISSVESSTTWQTKSKKQWWTVYTKRLLSLPKTRPLSLWFRNPILLYPT